MIEVSCPVCLKTHNIESWHNATARKYDAEWMVPINDPVYADATYICPNCGKESVGHTLTISA
ncbi:hypothetical protein COLU111180_04245 [Cohnella lubricantis]|uniref:Uncharacterized protein n=1 Tax=Cohnella lubricantis TaxID=2163172 RepID=A0A841T4J8_9BACL|nr:hypothetical protein [Cohnella lubricantis]MBB6676483.1 hypothetical protein [Cohnella lubricantis]MBP2117100.1 endogenous inhibitor of DNA gyrase (YacG/DUF329 family) [Cohnella lubricantis]